MKVCVVNPPLLSQKGDLFSSGIPYFPLGAAYVSSMLRSKGHEVTAIDSFGEKPRQVRKYKDKFVIQGLLDEEVLARIPGDASLVAFYGQLVTAHSAILSLIKKFKAKGGNAKIVVFENTQQVYAYSLLVVYKELLDAGADYVIMGEPEERIVKLVDHLEGGEPLPSDGIAHRENGVEQVFPRTTFIEDLDSLPFPAFDLYPIENYWALGYSHGPYSGKYLPLLTSRGCPYGCKYCVVPSTNSRKWRMRSAKNVVDEIEYWGKTLGITDFHWEDLNPTIRKDRIVEISQGIINRGLKVTWKISAGTKVESFDANTAEWMAKSGCVYVSISPESGSSRVLKLMDKPFNHAHGLAMVKKLDELGVKTQACFVLGYPGETPEDLQMTVDYLHELVKAGLDETALFIMTPIPGSEQYKNFTGFEDFAELTFTPMFRKDFQKLQLFRMKLYAKFVLWRLEYQPLKVLRNIFNLLTQKFQIKSEMTLWRIFKTHFVYNDPLGG